MIKRIITGALITVAVYVLICFSYITPLIYAATACLCMCAVYEIYHAIGVEKDRQLLFASLAMACVISILPIPQYEYILIAIFIVAVVLFVVLMMSMGSFQLINTTQAMIIAFIIVLLFKSIPALREYEDGLYYLIFAATICFITDVFAFLFGKAFGSHKLLPKISPNKTVEGAVGGVLVSLLVSTIILLIMEKQINLIFDRNVFVVYVILTSIVGQFGDLCMSVIKRICGIKDYSNFFPGHGGILDRFDSHLFGIAFTLIFCVITGGFIY